MATSENAAAYITVSAAATQLGVSTGLVYRLFHRDELEGIKVGSAVRISKSALARYIAAHTNTAPQPVEPEPSSAADPGGAVRFSYEPNRPAHRRLRQPLSVPISAVLRRIRQRSGHYDVWYVFFDTPIHPGRYLVRRLWGWGGGKRDDHQRDYVRDSLEEIRALIPAGMERYVPKNPMHYEYMLRGVAVEVWA
jgi:excisionase family DNA binding protein